MSRAATDSGGSLPKGWRWVKLGEVCEIEMGQSPPGSCYNREGQGLPLLNGPTEFGPKHPVAAQWTTVPTKRAQSGDILFCVRGATTGRKNIADGCYCIGRGLAAIRGRDGVAATDFIWHTLDVVTARMLTQASGSTFINLPGDALEAFPIPLPPIPAQKRIAAILNEQMAAVERARKAAEEQASAAELYPFALVRGSMKKTRSRRMLLGDCLDEVRVGVGAAWAKYPVLGATRQGLALAKDLVGKTPERYKPVTCGTVFYNPMRILLGSIAMVDESDTPGITSPDYVVVRGKDGILDSRWFYYWFRSPFGAHLIEFLSRGAVRERILFNRLAEGMIEVPPIEVQREASASMRHLAGARHLIEAQLDAIAAIPAALLRRAFAPTCAEAASAGRGDL